MNKRNIILIGMPGAGKSSVGVILAKVLGYEFIDTDLVIQHREKRLLREIIADEGNEDRPPNMQRLKTNINWLAIATPLICSVPILPTIKLSSTPTNWVIPFCAITGRAIARTAA